MVHRALLLGGLLTCLLSACAAQAGGERVVIPGVDRFRVVEPMFECVRIVLSQRGEKYSPAYIQGISGAAFRAAGPCPCAPTCSTAMEPEDLVKLLGYAVERRPMCGPGVDPEQEIGPLVARVKAELRAGRPAIVWHAFTNAEYDVVCGFDEAKQQFLGRGSYRGQDELAAEPETRPAKCVEICPALGAIFIGEKRGAFSARAAELAALEEAVRHGRSPRDRFLLERRGHELPWRFRNGVACYDAWTNSFRANPRRVPGVGDRYPLGVYCSTHRAAGEFLLAIAPHYPEGEQHLRAAAREFAADATALGTLYEDVCGGWSGWQAPDPARGTQAAKLLSQARKHYAAAIDHIAAALALIDPQSVARTACPRLPVRDGDRVTIANVSPLKFGQGKDCTLIGAMEAALATTEHPSTYADMMGLSGLAFRTRWSNGDTKTRWCHSAAVGELPDEVEALERLTGWHMKAEWLEPQGRDNEHLRRRLVAAIDAGHPVVGYASTLDVGVIHGYENGGKTLLTRDYLQQAESAPIPIEKLCQLHFTLENYETPPPLRDALLASLDMAVHNWHREKHHGGLPGREYWYGEAALRAWIGDVRKFETYDEKTRATLCSLDGWCYMTLVDARRAAVGFLNDWRAVLTGPACEALGRAAEAYKQEVKLLDSLPSHKRGGAGQKPDAWTADARRRELATLEAACALEATAVAELEAALAAEGKTGEH